MTAKNDASLSDFILDATRGTAVALQQGQVLSITNLQGNQVVDAWAVMQSDPFEYASMEHTRSVNSNLYFELNMPVVSIYRQPMFTLVGDTTPGRCAPATRRFIASWAARTTTAVAPTTSMKRWRSGAFRCPLPRLR